MSKFTDIVKATAAFIFTPYNDAKLIIERAAVVEARHSLFELIFNSESIVASDDRAVCRKQAESFEQYDAEIKSDLATIRKVDSYTAERLGRELDDVRSNLISMALFGLNTWHAIDAGHTIPARLPSAAVVAKPPVPKL